MNHEDFGRFVEKETWKEAKTYASFAPHEYVVKSGQEEKGTPKFSEFKEFIQLNGFPAFFGSTLYNYYYFRGHYYWTLGVSDNETFVVNRCKIGDYALRYNFKRKV